MSPPNAPDSSLTSPAQWPIPRGLWLLACFLPIVTALGTLNVVADDMTAKPGIAATTAGGIVRRQVVTWPTILAAGKIHWTDELRDFFRDYKLDDPWILFGFAAQAVFASRFMVQWIASERAGRSIVPTLFWYLSLLGTTMLAVYALHRKDVVFILGQTLNIFIYVRNLMLIYRPKDPGGGAG